MLTVVGLSSRREGAQMAQDGAFDGGVELECVDSTRPRISLFFECFSLLSSRVINLFSSIIHIYLYNLLKYKCTYLLTAMKVCVDIATHHHHHLCFPRSYICRLFLTSIFFYFSFAKFQASAIQLQIVTYKYVNTYITCQVIRIITCFCRLRNFVFLSLLSLIDKRCG